MSSERIDELPEEMEEEIDQELTEEDRQLVVKLKLLQEYWDRESSAETSDSEEEEGAAPQPEQEDWEVQAADQQPALEQVPQQDDPPKLLEPDWDQMEHVHTDPVTGQMTVRQVRKHRR